VEQDMSVQNSQQAAPGQPQQQGATAPVQQQTAGAATAPKPQIRDWASI
jgi:hypothetical protein